MRTRHAVLILSIGAICLASIVCYMVPSINERIASRVDDLRTKIIYFINPPQKNVFVPQGEVNDIVQATMQAMTGPSSTPNIAATLFPQSTPIPTIQPTPVPPAIRLEGVKYQTQHGNWNYCAPANLTMALSYWGVKASKLDVGNVLKPDERNDKNVMPYEMQDYVQKYTDLRMIYRIGGELNLLKALIANGFPVLVERGAHYSHAECSTCDEYWLGHFQLLTGYDEASQLFIAQDSFKKPDYDVPYQDLIEGWRSFDYLFLVVYPVNMETQLIETLGPWADNAWANQHALDIAANEIQTLSGVEQFFAWFNQGTGYVNLLNYPEAARAYDSAFSLYATIPEEERPFRILWYQTGPYFAYYYTGRFQDVINLTTQTLNAMSVPSLEESYVWRARSKAALGDTAGAVEDLNMALKYHQDFPAALEELQRLGY